MAAFTPAQVVGLTAAQLPTLSPAQVAALAPATLAALTAAQVTVLTAAQITALTSAQIAALTPTQIAALTSAQLAVFTPAMLASLTSAQSVALTSAQVAVLTSKQLAALIPASAPPAPTPLDLISNQIAQAVTTQAAADKTRSELTNLEAMINQLVPSQPDIKASFQLMADDLAIQEFGKDFAADYYVGEVTVENHAALPFLAYGTSLSMYVKCYVSRKEFGQIKTNNPELALQMKQGYYTALRRPSSYSDLLTVFEYQKDSDWRQQLMDYLTSAGTIAAAATPFAHGLDYSKAVALATGVVLPELQKRLLWDIILHSQNLENRSFKDTVEIPAGSDVTGIVFFPRGAISGIIADHDVYISSFDMHQSVGINGSLIQKSTATIAAPK